MAAHVDILDEPERLRGPFWSSRCAARWDCSALFVAATAICSRSGKVDPVGRSEWRRVRIGGGDRRRRAFRCRTAAAVPRIPVANDTESQVPQAPSKAKAAAEGEGARAERHSAQEPQRETDASVRQASAAEQMGATSRSTSPIRSTASGGQAVSSPVYNQPGGGGVGVRQQLAVRNAIRLVCQPPARQRSRPRGALAECSADGRKAVP